MGAYREEFLSSGLEDTEFQRFTYALEFVRRQHPTMTLGAFATFMSVARSASPEGISPTELGVRLGQPLPTIFRQCNQLADGVPGKPGMKLIKKVEDTQDGRSKKLALSWSGLGLLTSVMDILRAELPGYLENDTGQ